MLKSYHPTGGRMPRKATPTRRANPDGIGAHEMQKAHCPPGRGGPRGGKDIIGVGTREDAIANPVAPGAAWQYRFDVAEDCRAARLNVQVYDAIGGTLLDASTQSITQLLHNNVRLLSGAQVGGQTFDPNSQPGTNPVWGRALVVSDDLIISGVNNFPTNDVIITCTISTM